MGHSRGGEGVRAAYNIYKESTNPWGSSSGRIRNSITFKGIFEFAPTDRYAGTPLDANDTPRLAILPACDGDINTLDGLKPFDRMLQTSSETIASLKATYFVYGANHNFYNTQGQISDSDGCEGPDNNSLFSSPISDGVGGFGSPSQRKTELSSFLAFFRGNVGNSIDPSLNQNFDPRFELPSALSSITKIKKGYISSPSPTKTQKFNGLTFGLSQLDNDICTGLNIVCSGSSSTTIEASAKKVQIAQNDP